MTKKHMYKGKLHSYSSLETKSGIARNTLKYRIEAMGMSPEEAINYNGKREDVGKRTAKPQTCFGIKYDSITEMSQAYGRDRSTVAKRMNYQGLSPEDAVGLHPSNEHSRFKRPTFIENTKYRLNRWKIKNEKS